MGCAKHLFAKRIIRGRPNRDHWNEEFIIKSNRYLAINPALTTSIKSSLRQGLYKQRYKPA